MPVRLGRGRGGTLFGHPDETLKTRLRPTGLVPVNNVSRARLIKCFGGEPVLLLRFGQVSGTDSLAYFAYLRSDRRLDGPIPLPSDDVLA